MLFLPFCREKTASKRFSNLPEVTLTVSRGIAFEYKTGGYFFSFWEAGVLARSLASLPTPPTPTPQSMTQLKFFPCCINWDSWLQLTIGEWIVSGDQVEEYGWIRLHVSRDSDLGASTLSLSAALFSTVTSFLLLDMGFVHAMERRVGINGDVFRLVLFHSSRLPSGKEWVPLFLSSPLLGVVGQELEGLYVKSQGRAPNCPGVSHHSCLLGHCG